MAQIQGVEDDISPERIGAGLLLRGGQEQSQLVFGVGLFGAFTRLDPKGPEQPERGSN